jgi:molecular chaperone GrpE
MIVPRFVVLISALSGLVYFSDAFAFSRPTTVSRSVETWSFQTSTCLRAEEGVAAEPPQEESEKESSVTKGTAASDILSSPAFLRRKADVIKSDITNAEKDLADAEKRLEAGKEEWGAQIDDLQKEYQLIQQRMNTQSNQGDTMATVEVARKMLEVLDNFDRAFGQVTAETDSEKAIEAEYRAVYDMILSTFEKLGVEEIKSVGTEFDYEVHQAVMQRPNDEYEEGIVCEEYQKGFKIGDTLIRASMVAVAA